MVDYMRHIRDLREDSDMTQEEVAQVLGITQTAYSRYERGVNQLPVNHLISLCDLFKVSMDFVCERPPEYTRAIKGKKNTKTQNKKTKQMKKEQDRIDNK